MVFEQPRDSIVIAALLIGGQSDNQITIRGESLVAHANEIDDPDRGHRLVIAAADTVEVAVLFEKIERIEGPVFPLDLHDIEVGQEQQRRTVTGAAISDHDVALAGGGCEHLHIFFGEASCQQTVRDGFGGGGVVAHRIGRVDFDQFFERVPCHSLVGVERRLAVIGSRWRIRDEQAGDQRDRQTRNP